VTRTGWQVSEEPEEAPAAGFADFILKNRRAPDEGHTLEQVFARAAQARDREPERPGEDPDDKAAALLTRGYSPGMISQLSQQLGDVQAELEAEKELIEKGARRAAVIAQHHAAGRLGALGVMRALDEGDAGDEGRVRLLERRAASLRAQIADVRTAISPPERQAPGPVEAAAQRAQQALAQVAEELRLKDVAAAQARAQLERDRGEFYAARGRRPFVSRGAGRSTEHTGGVSIR
jgi:hypothetical protein